MIDDICNDEDAIVQCRLEIAERGLVTEPRV